ncbi:PREDICTED: uncharacterized protein LOC104706272 [Camelina sativa]|uniref:Uncharacterized protein LOC104706272 n=1 Tax=Camelina sativa TaxID=90675 RepID=A0ABM0T4G6_CAMSA|nr:PREDICTED: uncharacterized protein LOC104706272 [Camelina sativa]
MDRKNLEQDESQEVNRKENAEKNIYDMSLDLSILSEPPHIRNWFPSYVSQVQTVDKSDDYDYSHFGKNESDVRNEIREPNTKVKDIYNLCVANADHYDVIYGNDSDDEAKTGRVLREGKINPEEPSSRLEEEVNGLKNRVKYLESVIANLHDHIVRLVSSNKKRKM